jgi:maltooligosyltrehalose trehalohydrolase
MKTECRETFLVDLSRSARSVKSHAKLIIENMDNSASWLERDDNGDPKTYTAQWDDDVHHVLEYLTTGENKNGYDKPDADPIADLEKGLADGFIHDGEAADDSDGSTRNEPGSKLPPRAFVTYVQNHDQIGNRADSARLPDRIGVDKLDFLHFVSMVTPHIPLFFIGEEAHLRTHFPFFIDLPEEAAKPKRDDRYKQMRETFDEEVEDGELPDPNDPATFQMAKVDWSDFARQQQVEALTRFRQLALWRKDHIWPLAASRYLDAKSARQGNGLVVSWIFEAGTLTMALNADERPADIACVITAPPIAAGTYEQHGEVLRLGAWSAVAWTWLKG